MNPKLAKLRIIEKMRRTLIDDHKKNGWTRKEGEKAFREFFKKKKED